MTAILPVKPSPIATGVRDCLDHFDSLILDLETHDEYESFSKAIIDALGRFKIWSGNIGAHRTGQRSLEHRLRDASHLQKQVLRLLKGLMENLGDAREISSGVRVPWDQLQLSDSDTDDDDDSGNDENTDTTSTIFQDVQYKTEMDQILAGINEAIVNLLRLSATIRNPARHDQFLNFSKLFDTTPFEQFDISHVIAKYPRISPHLASRLGTASSRRRCFFRYCEGHYNKMAAGLILEDTNDETTVASSLPDRHKVSAIGLSILTDDDNQSDGGFTATSFATSLSGTTELRVPPLPTNATYDNHFQCPFCYNIVMVNNRASWKKHVYSDLQPYMCLWESCPIGRRMFSTRHEWLLHEQDYHGKVWVCCLGCPDSFKDRHNMQDHYAKRHKAQTEGQMKKFMQASETQKVDSRQYTCPLCSTTTTSMKAYAKHAGKHLRELALFALPAYPTKEEVSDDESENESGHESEQEPENEPENEYTKELGIADKIADYTSLEFPFTVQADNLGIPSDDFDALQDTHDSIPSQNESFREDLTWGTTGIEEQQDMTQEGSDNSPSKPILGTSESMNLDFTGEDPKVAKDGSENESEENESRDNGYGSEGNLFTENKRSQPEKPLENEREARQNSAGLFNKAVAGQEDAEDERTRVTFEESLSKERDEAVREAIQKEHIRSARKYAQEAARAETETSAQATQSHSQIEYEARKNAEEEHERTKFIFQSQKEKEKEARSKKERELDPSRPPHSHPSVERTHSSGMDSTSLTDTDTAIPPAKTQAAYAGPTFHASPAPSSLPIPKFSSQFAPSKTRISPSTPPLDKYLNSSSSPSQQPVPIRSRHQDSPLNMFFEADRAERARKQEIEPSPHGNVNWGGVDRYEVEEARRWVRTVERIQEQQEELIKRKMELKYLIDRQERADEEARIELEEELFVRDWDERLKKREKEEWERFLLKQKQKEEEARQAQSKRDQDIEQKHMDVSGKPSFPENRTEGINNPEQANPFPLRRQPTFVKAHKEHLDVETLRYYDIPYEIDIKNPDYIIILRELEPRETEILFEHTRRLRRRGGSSVLVDGPNDGSENELRGQKSTRDGENQSERVVGVKEMFF